MIKLYKLIRKGFFVNSIIVMVSLKGIYRAFLRPLHVEDLAISVTDSLGFPLYSEENGQHGKGVVFNSYIGNPGTAAKYTNKDAKIEVTLGRDEAKKNARKITLSPDPQFFAEARVGNLPTPFDEKHISVALINVWPLYT